jgi:pyrophosphatase PpaX
LIDSIPFIVETFQHTFVEVLGITRQESDIRSWIGQSLRECYEREYPDRAAELFEAYIAYNEAAQRQRIVGFPGVRGLVEALIAAGAKVAVATSKRLVGAQIGLELAQIDDLIATVITHDDTARHKPFPDPLLMACDQLGVDPADSVYVGDAVVDILAGQAAGMSQIGVNWGASQAGELLAAEPTAVVDSIGQLQSRLIRQAV